MSRKYDFHGVTVEDALEKIERVIDEIRLREPDGEIVEFVTGHGVIKFEARELLEKKYGFEIFSPLTSPSIVLTIV